MTDRIIVTGGAGFIGSNLVAALNARGFDRILIVDHLGQSEKWRNLRGLRFDDYLDKADFIDLVGQRKLDPAWALFHLGACSSTTETDADYLMRNNYQYSRQLCEWAIETRTRFIYASSAATYGDGAQGYIDDASAAALQDLKPLNMYGYSKLLFDQWAERKKMFDKIVGLKFFNVYGPREAHKGEMRSKIHKAFYEIQATGEIALFKSYRDGYADGEQRRDFVHVQDAVAVMLYFFDHPKVSGLFNCGTGESRTWLDLAKGLFAAMGREPRVRWIEMPESIREQYQYFTEADLTNLRRAGYTAPFLSLEEGIADYVRGELARS